MSNAHPGADPVRVVTVTVSDSRASADDESGAVLRTTLSAAGFAIVRHQIVPDDPAQIREIIQRAIDAGEADAVICTGGTGLAPRDQTYEAVAGLLEKTLDGFGEAFRRLSWEQVGPRAILSRAVAGSYRRGFVAALPGSPKAVALGVTQVLAPVLGHAVAILKSPR